MKRSHAKNEVKKLKKFNSSSLNALLSDRLNAFNVEVRFVGVGLRFMQLLSKMIFVLGVCNEFCERTLKYSALSYVIKILIELK